MSQKKEDSKQLRCHDCGNECYGYIQENRIVVYPCPWNLSVDIFQHIAVIDLMAKKIINLLDLQIIPEVSGITDCYCGICQRRLVVTYDKAIGWVMMCTCYRSRWNELIQDLGDLFAQRVQKLWKLDRVVTPVGATVEVAGRG